MQHAEICRTLTEKINLLKDKHEMLSSLLPDVRLLYGTQPGPRTPVMYQPGIVFPRFYVSTSKSIIKALINMHSFEIQLSPIG